ncbi:MAG: VWA domain-containing protein, partial [Myxococcota bacterium]
MTPWRFSILGYKAGFAQPWFLAGVGVALLLGVVAIIVSVRRSARLSKAVPNRLAEVLAPGVSVVLPSIQSSAYTLALVFFAFALAQPQCGEKAEVAKRRGIDVVVALDASKSMYARDVTPSRLERAKLELTTLLDSLKGDRVGLVVFAGDAFIQCPLTSDYAAAKLFLRAVDPEQMPQGGTNIGAALQLSRQVLENADRGAKDRVVVLLSDGEDLTGDINEGIDALKDFGARVLAIGIGSDSGEPIPIINRNGDVAGYKKDENGVTVISRLDRAGLQHIASATGGEFFTQPRGVAMGEVLKIIDTLQKSELESRLTMKYGEAYQPFLAIGLVFLVLGFLVVPSWRRARSVALVFAVFAAARVEAAGPFEKNHPAVQKGTTAFEAQKFDEALEHYDAALKERPTDARVHYDRGLALHKLNRNDEAKQAFQQALELDRTGELAAKIHYNLGNVAAAAGDKKAAITEYRTALRKDPSDELARHNLEVLLKNLPPQQAPGSDGGTPDGGGHDGGRPDAGQDAGIDGGSDAGRPDGGQPDGGEGDGGRGDGGMDAGS